MTSLEDGVVSPPQLCRALQESLARDLAQLSEKLSSQLQHLLVVLEQEHVVQPGPKSPDSALSPESAVTLSQPVSTYAELEPEQITADVAVTEDSEVTRSFGKRLSKRLTQHGLQLPRLDLSRVEQEYEPQSDNPSRESPSNRRVNTCVELQQKQGTADGASTPDAEATQCFGRRLSNRLSQLLAEEELGKLRSSSPHSQGASTAEQGATPFGTGTPGLPGSGHDPTSPLEPASRQMSSEPDPLHHYKVSFTSEPCTSSKEVINYHAPSFGNTTERGVRTDESLANSEASSIKSPHAPRSIFEDDQEQSRPATRHSSRKTTPVMVPISEDSRWEQIKKEIVPQGAFVEELAREKHRSSEGGKSAKLGTAVQPKRRATWTGTDSPISTKSPASPRKLSRKRTTKELMGEQASDTKYSVSDGESVSGHSTTSSALPRGSSGRWAKATQAAALLKQPSSAKATGMTPELEEMFKRQLCVGDELVAEGLIQHVMVHPNSKWRLSWDLSGFLLIVYDVVMIPLMQCFELPDSLLFAVMAWSTTMFWTFDCFFSFITGFYIEGFVEMRPMRIARRYLRTWFFPDILVILIDWTFILVGLGDTAGVLRIGKSARALRILRAIRLLRIAKVAELLTKITDGLNSELALMLVKIFKLVLCVVIVNHYIACIWHLIAYNSIAEYSWITKYNVQDRSIAYRYTTSLHWSLTQFMPASMEINPASAQERSFAIFVLIFGMVTFSSFVSSITQMTSQLRNISADRIQAETNLRQYLNENRISVQLGIRIRKFFRENYEARKKRMHELDISFFNELPQTVQMELRKEIYAPILRVHPLFEQLEAVDAPSLWLLCHLAVCQRTFTAGQTIFCRGELAREMVFIVSGELEYFYATQIWPTMLTSGQWLCEAALWNPRCENHGRLSASTTCELLGLDAAKFRALMEDRTKIKMCFQRYGKSFLESCSSMQDNVISTDISEQVNALQILVTAAFDDLEGDVDNRVSSKTSQPSAKSNSSARVSFLLS